MSADTMIKTMKSLKLHGMAHSVGELDEQGSPAYRQSIPLLQQLTKAEVADRKEGEDVSKRRLLRYENQRRQTVILLQVTT